MTSIGMSLPFARASAGMGRAMAALWSRWQYARKVAETRRYLEQMDSHMLKDLGVSRAQAFFEVDEARWHGR